MNWILDIALGCVFLAVVLIYTFRGFVRSVWGLVKVILSLFLSYFFGGVAALWLYSAFVLKGLSDMTRAAIMPMLSEVQGKFDIAELFSRLPAGFVDLVEGCGTDISQLSADYSGITMITEDQVSELSQKIASPVARTISNAAGYVLVFLIALIVLSVVGWIAMAVSEVNGISKVNKLLGACLGVIVGFIYVWMLCLAVSIFVEKQLAGVSGDSLRSIAENSYIFRFFCDISPLDFVNIKSIVQFGK